MYSDRDHGCSMVNWVPMAVTRGTHSASGSDSRPGCWFQQITSIQTYCSFGSSAEVLHHSLSAPTTSRIGYRQAYDLQGGKHGEGTSEFTCRH